MLSMLLRWAVELSCVTASMSTLPSDFATDTQMCMGFFQSTDVKMMAALDMEEVANRNMVPHVMLMTASTKVAASMNKGRFVMTDCLDANGVLKLAGFLPLEMFLKWFTVDPEKQGVLVKTHPVAKQHDCYR